MSLSILNGVTRPAPWTQPKNPTEHSPVAGRNHLIVEVLDRKKKLKSRTEHFGNILVTNGLSRLAQLIATGGTSAPASNSWVNHMMIGTANTAESSTQTALGNSTGSVALGGGSLSVSDQGARTTRWVATFASNNPAGAASINEVGLFFTTTAATTMIARSMLGTDSVNKGASDQINISYDVIMTTA